MPWCYTIIRTIGSSFRRKQELLFYFLCCILIYEVMKLYCHKCQISVQKILNDAEKDASEEFDSLLLMPHQR